MADRVEAVGKTLKPGTPAPPAAPLPAGGQALQRLQEAGPAGSPPGDALHLSSSSGDTVQLGPAKAPSSAPTPPGNPGTASPPPAPAKPPLQDNPSGPVAPQTAQERKAVESTYFKGLYEAKNIQLDPMQPGEGPYQVLDRMNQEGKLAKSPWTQEQVQSEAVRIRNRDFKSRDRGRRPAYAVGEQTPRWTEGDITQKVAENVDRMRGIDVSHHNGSVDWQKVKDAGYEFAFLKATGGDKFVDPTFAENRKAAREAGLAVGYYHYFRPNAPVDKQVDNFVKTVGKPENDMLRMVVDTEDAEQWKPYSHEQRLKMISDFREGVKKATGVDPKLTIYGSPAFFRDELDNHPSLKKNDLWIANYPTPEPTIPGPWKQSAFWQYSEHGKVPGIDHDVDLDMVMRPDVAAEIRRRTRSRSRS